MKTISRLSNGSYLVTEAAGTKEACQKLQSMGYRVTSTANLEHSQSQAPRAHSAYLKGQYQEI